MRQIVTFYLRYWVDLMNGLIEVTLIYLENELDFASPEQPATSPLAKRN
jgi:hypothetical protein